MLENQKIKGRTKKRKKQLAGEKAKCRQQREGDVVSAPSFVKRPLPKLFGQEPTKLGFRYLRVGEVIPDEVLCPADAPVESQRIFHCEVPLSAISGDPESLKRAKKKAEAAVIRKLANHLKSGRQLFPCRLVRMILTEEMKTDAKPDSEGCVYGVVSGLRIVLAAIKAQHEHVRAEVLPAYCDSWPRAARADVASVREYEQEWVTIYYGGGNG